jgi:hypothetical protein
MTPSPQLNLVIAEFEGVLPRHGVYYSLRLFHLAQSDVYLDIFQDIGQLSEKGGDVLEP